MAETMGRVYKLLLVFLQDARGLYSWSVHRMHRIRDFQLIRDFYFSPTIYGFVFAAK